MLQLQQLGLHLGFRSHVIWREDYLNNNFHQTYGQNKAKYPGGANCYEKTHIR